MYVPKHFRETDTGELHKLIRAAPLGILVIHTRQGLVANHLPFVLDEGRDGPDTLRAHIPRANPLAAELENETECLVIFHGPDGYISPSWYATKKQHGKVVPTWNYAVVHAHGRVGLVDDASWVEAQLNALTKLNEEHRREPWSLSDAPREFTQRLIASLVGLRISIRELAGKTKASQNQPVENQRSILEALADERPETGLLDLMQSVLSESR